MALLPWPTILSLLGWSSDAPMFFLRVQGRPQGVQDAAILQRKWNAVTRAFPFQAQARRGDSARQSGLPANNLWGSGGEPLLAPLRAVRRKAICRGKCMIRSRFVRGACGERFNYAYYKRGASRGGHRNVLAASPTLPRGHLIFCKIESLVRKFNRNERFSASPEFLRSFPYNKYASTVLPTFCHT